MSETTKFILACCVMAVCTLIGAALPATLFISLYKYTMSHLPASEAGLIMPIRIGYLLIGGSITIWVTLIYFSLSAALSIAIMGPSPRRF